MRNEKNISRGGLSGKMNGYQQEPPASVWEGISAGLQDKRPGRKMWFWIIGSAAAIAIAATVGITLLFNDQPQELVDSNTAGQEISREEATSLNSPGEIKPEVETSDNLPETSERKPSATGNESNNTSRLKQKVLTAMQEVVNEQAREATGQLAVTGNQDESTGEQPNEPIDHQAISENPDQDDAGLADDGNLGNNNETDREGNIRNPGDIIDPGLNESGQSGSEQQDSAESAVSVNSKVNAVVNEDSLLNLLQQDDIPEITEEKRSGQGRWQLGATLSPLVSYRDAASLDAAQNFTVNNAESARLTYAGGVRISYLPSERLAVETGVFYNKMGVNIGEYSNFKNRLFQNEMDMAYSPGRTKNVVSISNSMGTIVSSDNSLFVNNYSASPALTDYHMLTPEQMVVDNAAVESFTQTFEYLEVPFNLRYKIIDRTIDLQLIGGLSTNFLVSNSIDAITGEEAIEIGQVEDIRTINYSGNAGLGIVYEIFKNFNISMEPRFRYYLNSVNADILPATRPYTIGLYTGVNYKF